MVMMSPFLSVTPIGHQRAALVVDAERAGARDAGLAHAARHHRRVAGHAAARGQDAFGRVHAVNVFRAGLDAHEDDLAANAFASSASSEVKTISPVAAPGEAGRPERDDVALGLGVDGRVQQAGRARPDRCAHRLLAR
jgi:hypothetical protein